MIYDRLPVGTFVQVIRSKLVEEVCVVTNEYPLILRPATSIERFKCWWRSKRVKTGEIGAAVEANAVIQQARLRV